MRRIDPLRATTLRNKIGVLGVGMREFCMIGADGAVGHGLGNQNSRFGIEYSRYKHARGTDMGPAA